MSVTKKSKKNIAVGEIKGKQSVSVEVDNQGRNIYIKSVKKIKIKK